MSLYHDVTQENFKNLFENRQFVEQKIEFKTFFFSFLIYSIMTSPKNNHQVALFKRHIDGKKQPPGGAI